MSVLLYVHLKNEVFPIYLPFPLFQGNTLSLSPMPFYPTSQFLNCMQKSVTSVHHSWELGIKKPKTILLEVNNKLDKEISDKQMLNFIQSTQFI